jgi:ADP-heptose:LPS heptosyltransferase
VTRSTSSFSLEAKKRVDLLLGVPAARLLGLARRRRVADPRRADPYTVRHVVLAKLWGIGNLAMLLPYVAAIRRRFPLARVTFLTLERNRALLEGQPGVDELVTVRDRGLFAPLADLARAVASLRRAPIDLFLDFEQFLRVAGLVARLARVRFAVGFDTPGQHRAALYDVAVPCRGDRHMALGFAELVRAAGVATEGCASHEVAVLPEADATARAIVSDEWPRPWIVVHPGSGDNFPGRRWPTDRFAETGARLVREFGGTLLLTGTESEAALLRELVVELAARGVRGIELGGRLELPVLVALLARADLLLSNDTGPVHLASAVRTPVVGFYGPNSPKLYGPIGADHRALYKPLPCSPCLTNQNGKSSQCTLPVCIRRIHVDEGYAAAVELLAPRFARHAVAAT